MARKKCAGCKISVHTMCMEQLEKVNSASFISGLTDSFLVPVLTVSSSPSVQINFRCKPSFREPGCRAVREVGVSVVCVILPVLDASGHVQYQTLVVFQPNVVRHHWVHRRRQTGKCRQCGKVRLHRSLQTLIQRA